MGRAWYLPTSENIIEDYTENNQVYDHRRDLHYEMISRDGQFLQREYRLDEYGALIHELVRQASYVVGSGEHVRSYVADSGGYLTQLPISWYSDEKKWGLSPGYETFNHRFDRPIGPGCIACHNDYPKFVQATLNKYESPVPTGIGCERCHGPAEWHVRQQTDGWQPPRQTAVQPTIVNPAQLSGSLKDDVCFQCHLQGDAEFVNPGMEQYGYRPGLRLADYRSVYQAETSDPDKFGIASHAARMVQSRCFTESAGRFNCITCHDPHVPLREVQAETYLSACLNCHTKISCKRTADGSVAHQQNDCVTCHMPRGHPADVQHTVFTDHWIRRPQQSENTTEPKPLPAGPVLLRAFWDDPKPDEERQGLAHLSFAFAKGGRANLEFGIELLQKAALHGNLHLEGWRRLGMAGLAKRDPSLAGSAFQQALRLDPNDGKSQMGFGMALGAFGDLDRALAELESANRSAPDQLDAYPEVSAIHMQRRQPERALAVLEQSLRLNPHQPRVLAMIATVHCQDLANMDQGIDAFRRAIQLDPDNVYFRVSLGAAYMTQGNLEASREQLQLALRLAPDSVPALLTLARVYMLRQEKSEAIKCLEQVLILDPKNQYAQQILRELGSSAGPN